MLFSEETNDNEEILESHQEKVKEAGFKKYVININNKYVPLVDSMSTEDRNEVINDIIAEHDEHLAEKRQIMRVCKASVFVIISLIILLFAAPSILWLVNQSFTLTKNNYSEMQTNFEVLYRNKKNNF